MKPFTFVTWQIDDDTILRSIPYVGDDNNEKFLNSLSEHYEDNLVRDSYGLAESDFADFSSASKLKPCSF